VCSPFVPAFDREAGNQRIWTVLSFLREGGWDVTLVAKQSTSDDARYASLLRQQGIATFIEPGAELRRIITCGQFDIAVFSFWFIGVFWGLLVRTLSPSTRVLIDSIDMHFVRNARGLARAGRNDSSRVFNPSFGELLLRELNVYLAADAVLTVSQKEADLINDLIGDEWLGQALPLAEMADVSPFPVDQRHGLLFIGNFKHPPNLEAAGYLLSEILPALPPSLLERHPLLIVGNALDSSLIGLAGGLEHVRLVGWVPSVMPYLERARVSLVPLLHGAGTKLKAIQSLMVGTPVVSTPVGVEGLPLENERDVLVAGGVKAFASSVERLVEDDELWRRLATNGRRSIAPVHGFDAGRTRLAEIVSDVLARPVKSASLARAGLKLYRRRLYEEYEDYNALRVRVRAAVEELVPAGAAVAVVSRGDDELLPIDGRRAWHFPSTDNGVYAGFYPADSDGALEMLANVRERGAEFLVVPWTSLWWLEHYKDFGEFLARRCPPAVQRDDCCVLFDLRDLDVWRDDTV
jgi:glycosyltransferase involved in cell wall biosynthesis